MSERRDDELALSLKETPLSSERIFSGRIINVECWKVRCANGDEASREIVLLRGAAAVVAVDRITWEIPAGKLDSADEDPLLCAVRELKEETGLSASSMTELTRLLTTPGFCSENIAIYLAEGLTQGDTHPDPDEVLRIVRVPLSEAVSMVMRGEIRDAKTVCALLMTAECLRRRKQA